MHVLAGRTPKHAANSTAQVRQRNCGKHYLPIPLIGGIIGRIRKTAKNTNLTNQKFPNVSSIKINTNGSYVDQGCVSYGDVAMNNEGIENGTRVFMEELGMHLH
ncbi:hypothetical protein LguiA_034599 [Lonicera macranthoides]